MNFYSVIIYMLSACFLIKSLIAPNEFYSFQSITLFMLAKIYEELRK